VSGTSVRQSASVGSSPDRSSTTSTHATIRGATSSAIAAGVGSKPGELRQLAEEREVGGARPSAHDEA
jgi:hypothetical protein